MSTDKQLDKDVRLGIIEKVEPNTATISSNMDKEPRRVSKNGGRASIFEQTLHHYTHHTLPPFQQARSIPLNTHRAVTKRVE